ncbi:hypothetical protein [Curtobacterium flaccumfaciens]|uniref:hypothetical protein n=1 Tax=Curtobacterium flaccumfaciens TaxID=2035 RepID=UPI0020322F21|nr:hypothetical protein [Curtobacterium flaccumfaciens]MCS0471319.1 hypothetical protein [Curtobacterium flaccumfaciens pv. betae]MCS0474143.1 hypothetical protein [Curtobacterium flaccumfaciens pv. betae]MCS0477550.1 hypothetical protein [Curtobacterium flaccumfaciens pv. betae]MCS0482721.1 hypothetical protein [Curtobacterium flaccumfaciens pv. betae]MCS0485019.1 hypothetical protein [Curtobacterium flaccumfaciens pv. betae]
MRESTEIEQRCRGGQVDQQVDVTVFGVLPAHRGAEEADVVEVEALRLVEDRVGVDGERDARAGVRRFRPLSYAEMVGCCMPAAAARAVCERPRSSRAARMSSAARSIRMATSPIAVDY